jgi:O-antigen ligase
MNSKIIHASVVNKQKNTISTYLFSFGLSGLIMLTLTKPLLINPEMYDHSLGSLVRQLSYAALILSVISGILLRKDSIGIFKVFPLPIVILLSWCALSLLWSPYFFLSLQHISLTVMVTCISFICVGNLGARKSIFIIRVLLAIGVAINFVTVFATPTIGVHDYGVPYAREQWRGFMSHKNIAGSYSAIAAIFFILNTSYYSKFIRYALFTMAGASCLFLFFSQSRTSMIGLAAALAVGGTISLYSKAIARIMHGHHRDTIKKLAIFICFSSAIILIYLTVNKSILLEITRDPEFLSKRSQIWQPVLESYFDKPIFGAGYGAYWIEKGKNASTMIAEEGNFFSGVNQAHNGYLDLAVQVGIIGLLISLVSVIFWPISVSGKLLPERSSLVSLCLGMTTFFIVNNTTESSLFEGDQLTNVFCMLVFSLLAGAAERQRSRKDYAANAVFTKRRRRTGESISNA